MSSHHPPKSNRFTVIFIIILCFFSALVLSIVASLLKEPQKEARELDQVKQLLIAAKILSYDGTFLIPGPNNKFVQAAYSPQTHQLEPGNRPATKIEIFEVYKNRVIPMLVTSDGNLVTFKQAGLDYLTYLGSHQASGFSHLPYKLIYVIRSQNPSDSLPYAYIIPVNGYGLWGPIYGYLAIEANANTVLGTTWYDQKETAGLGANIATSSWQEQFYEKKIFRPSSSGQTNYKDAPLGISVVKGKVSEVYPNSTKADTAVDGIPGATLTGNGVTAAYHNCLAPYRPFLIKTHNKYEQVMQEHPQQ